MPGSLEYRSSSAVSASSRVLDVEKFLCEGSSRSESCLNVDEVSTRAQGLRSSRGSDMVCDLFCVLIHTGDKITRPVVSALELQGELRDVS